MNCFQGVKHLQDSTSNIQRYSQRPLSWLHLHGIIAPSTIMESNTFKAVPAIFTNNHSALYHGWINLALQRHLPSIQRNHLRIAMHFVLGVKHLQGSTSNIERYSQCPLSRLHFYGITAPSTVMESNTFKAVPAIFTNIHSALYHGWINLALQRHLPSWSQTLSRQH